MQVRTVVGIQPLVSFILVSNDLHDQNLCCFAFDKIFHVIQYFSSSFQTGFNWL